MGRVLSLMFLSVSFIIICIVSSGASFAANFNTKEFAFSNGFKLIVQEDHRSPLVVSQIWYKVGSSYERRGITGISHMLEHMMFKGTQNHPTGTLVNLITEIGGKQNAFTDVDGTAYFQEMAVENLELSFKLEADRMQNLVFDDKEFVTERKVVTEERRLRTENIPDNQLLERFLAVAHIGSPYHHPIIGWMQDIESYQLSSIKQWYHDYYSPNNAVLVVVGDVVAQDVYALAKKYFADIQPTEATAKNIYRGPDNIGTRRLEINLPSKVAKILIGFNVPSLNTADAAWEPYALDVLTSILSAGEASRLQRDVVRNKKLAALVNASYCANRMHDSIFYISGVPNSGVALKTLEAEFLSQIEQLKQLPVTDAELARVKTNVIAENIYAKDLMFYQAYELGMLEAIGQPWKLAKEYVDNIKSVTTEQLQAVANKYLQPNRMTIALMTPNDPEQVQTVK